MPHKIINHKLMFHLLVGVMSAVLWGALLPALAQADSPVFVRPAGHDALCNGSADADYSPAAAPACAVQSAQVGLSLAQPGDSVIVTGSGGQSVTLPQPPQSGELTIAASPALSVTKTGSAASLLVRTPLTYTIRITNISGATINTWRLLDILPPTGAAAVKSIDPAGSCAPLSADVISCTQHSLANGAASVVTIVITPTAAGTLNNLAIGSALDPLDPTSVFDNELTTVIGLTDLEITKSDSPDPVFAGQSLTYTLSITNNGPEAAASVVVTDSLPGTVQFNPASPDCGHSGGIVTCTTALLGVPQNISFTVWVTPTQAGLITNTARVFGGGTDNDQSNNVATQTTTVNHPGFSVVKSAEPPHGATVDPGDRITYTVVMTNSFGNVTNFVLTDTIPAGTTYVPGSAARNPNLGGISFDGSRVVLGVPNFPNGTTLTATFQVTVTTQFTTTFSNAAQLNSDQTSLQSSNTVTHAVRGTASGIVYLPLIVKAYEGASLNMYWNSAEPVRDKVSNIPGGLGLRPDTLEDGIFTVELDLGSTGPKTVNFATLVSTQGVQWDTSPTGSNPVLGIFDSGTALNNTDGSILYPVNAPVQAFLYASDDLSRTRFISDTYTYTVTINFTDGTNLTAEARIPPPPPPPPPPSCIAPQLLATVTVGNSPRGVAADTGRSNRAYVANFGSSSVSVIANNAVTATISGVTSANGIAYDSTNDLIWVTNYSTNQVTPIAATSPYTQYTPIGVGAGPWGVAHNSGNNMVYVANRSDNTVTVINASTRAVVATLSGSFAEPSHVAANPVTGKAYVSNVSGTSVTVIDGAAVSKIVGLTDSTQPYGVAVDETRNLVYVASIDSHRVSVIGELGGTPDQFLGWAAFHRGFNNPARPVPLRVIAVNPGIGPSGDGGHLWTTTSTNDGSEANQALLIPKGWDSYFAMPVARSVGLNPAEGVAVDRTTNRAYVTSGATPGTVSIFSDESSVCLEPFAVSEPEFGFEVQTVP